MKKGIQMENPGFETFRKVKIQAAVITSLLAAAVFTIRAAITGITYDEAFHYNA